MLKENERFAKLELIKERMITFFDQPDETSAKAVLEEVGTWIYQCGFVPLIEWCRRFEKGWDTVKNYFIFKVTTGVSEGINRAIKGLKWQAYGYRDMEYFKLKILQKVGYLNSRSSLTTV